jgi:hypothetical protein
MLPIVLMEYTLRRTNQPLGRLHPILLQELDGPLGGEMSTLLVRRSEFQGGNQLAVAFKLRLGEHAGLTPIAAVRRARLQERASARYTVVGETSYNWATPAV